MHNVLNCLSKLSPARSLKEVFVHTPKARFLPRSSHGQSSSVYECKRMKIPLHLRLPQYASILQCFRTYMFASPKPTSNSLPLSIHSPVYQRFACSHPPPFGSSHSPRSPIKKSRIMTRLYTIIFFLVFLFFLYFFYFFLPSRLA